MIINTVKSFPTNDVVGPRPDLQGAVRASAKWSSGLFNAAHGCDVGRRSWAICESCSVRGEVTIVWQRGWESKGWRRGMP